MSEDDKINRAFQYDLAKAQIDFEFWFTLAIGLLAIAYGLLSYFKDIPFGIYAIDGLIIFVIFFLVRIHNLKEQRFKDIKKNYIDGLEP